MPRLLILCEYPTLLGGERSMLATLPAVAAAGFEVLAAAPPRGPLADELLRLGVSHLTWHTLHEDGQRLPLRQLRAELANLVRRTRPNILHANSLSTSRISGPIAPQCRVPSIGHLRDILKLTTQAIDDLNAHKRLVAVSHATRNFHLAQGLSASKCVVIHNGVDLTEFRPQPSTGYLHRELRVPASAQFVAIIGQLGLRKGTDVALSAAQQIAKELPNIHWLVVGERTSNKDESSKFEESLRSMATKPPLTGRVHFLGSRTDVSAILVECDLLVHAARQEPLGRVLLEAAASGLAIVATDVGGTREIFPNEDDAAVLVPADDCCAIADAVTGLMQDDRRRKAIGAAARQRARAVFDVQNAAANLIEQYRTVLM